MNVITATEATKRGIPVEELRAVAMWHDEAEYKATRMADLRRGFGSHAEAQDYDASAWRHRIIKRNLMRTIAAMQEAQP